MRQFILPFIISIGLIIASLPYIGTSPYTVREDPKGVPIVDYGWLMGKYIGERKNPVTIASSAEKYYSYYRETGSNEHFVKFFNNVDWLKENRKEIEDFIVFPADFEYPFYGCEKGWVSAMAQGLALKGFLHAYELSRDEEYLDLARKVMNSYKVSIERGGLLFIDPEDEGYWYPEYACNTPPKVLNGFWFALDGLHYYHNVTGDVEAKMLYESGLEELLLHLPEFDNGDWTNYDMEGFPSDMVYHQLHGEIMEQLYIQTGNRTFLEYKTRWESYRYSGTRFYYRFFKALLLKFLE